MKMRGLILHRESDDFYSTIQKDTRYNRDLDVRFTIESPRLFQVYPSVFLGFFAPCYDHYSIDLCSITEQKMLVKR